MDPALVAAAFRDASLSPEKRADDLLARMTRDEKIAQLCSVWLTLDPASGDFAPFQGMFMNTPIDQRELLRHGIGQITRPFGSRPVAPRDGARALNAFQRHLVETTRLGIPAIAHEEALTGFMTSGATQFPSPLNYGATWDPALIRRVADAIRRQMRSVGTHQALAPVADVVRDARWGRDEECVGEDAYPGRVDRLGVRRGPAGRRSARRHRRHAEALLRLFGQRGRPQLRAAPRRVRASSPTCSCCPSRWRSRRRARSR